MADSSMLVFSLACWIELALLMQQNIMSNSAATKVLVRLVSFFVNIWMWISGFPSREVIFVRWNIFYYFFLRCRPVLLSFSSSPFALKVTAIHSSELKERNDLYETAMNVQQCVQNVTQYVCKMTKLQKMLS